MSPRIVDFIRQRNEAEQLSHAGLREEEDIFAEAQKGIERRERISKATADAQALLAGLRAAGMVLPMLPMWLADP